MNNILGDLGSSVTNKCVASGEYCTRNSDCCGNMNDCYYESPQSQQGICGDINK